MQDKLRAYIKAHSITQREMAEHLDVTEEHLSRIITGKSPVNPSIIGRFAWAYGFEDAAKVFGIGRAEITNA